MKSLTENPAKMVLKKQCLQVKIIFLIEKCMEIAAPATSLDHWDTRQLKSRATEVKENKENWEKSLLKL